MKKKEIADKAKKAWEDAVAAKKEAAEITKLKAAYETAQADHDAEEAAKNIVTLEEIQQSVAKQVKEVLGATLDDKLKGLLTEEGVKKVVTDVFTARDNADKLPDRKELGSLIQQVAEGAVGAIRKESKMIHDSEDHSLEAPVSWRKGNLPVHGKQLLNIMLQKPMNEGIDKNMLERAKSLGDQMIDRYRGMARRGQKALTSTGAGTGDEFVPTDLSAELQRRFYLASNLAALMAAREIDMPTQPYQFPLSTTRTTFYLNATENTATTASDPGTGSLTLDAKRFMGQVNFSYEVDEDSIIPILGWVEEQLALASADAFEGALINGDTAGTHQDSDTAAVTNHASKAFNGLRKLALAVAALKKDLSTGGISASNLRVLKKALGKYGRNPRDLTFICSVNAENDILGIAEALTVDKFGPRATILTGEVAAIYNIPIIVSSQNRDDLNASGVYDGSTTTKGSILLANLANFLTGRRREFTVETFRDITTQTNKVVASFRRALTPLETPSASISTVAIGYNYTT